MTFPLLAALFIGMPMLELWLLIRVGQVIGAPWTIVIVVLTGAAGAWLAKLQGLMVIMEIQRDVAEGRMPAPRMLDGVMILIAGVLMITPGFVTDAAGFALLVPAVRYSIRQWMRRKLEQKLSDGSININTMHDQ
jgi:UPF0716 protein FxsA